MRTEMIKTGFRPIRSDDGPATKAPTTRPNGAALITRPNAGREMSHSCKMEGVTKPIMATSMPSATTTMKHSATKSHWNAEMGCSSIKALISTVFPVCPFAPEGAARRAPLDIVSS